MSSAGRPIARRSDIKLPATLGRGKDADLTVAHPLISRHHCRLEELDGALVLRDNNSTNGTFVGKKRITQVVLKPGDQFTVGPLTFKAEYQHSGEFPNLGRPIAKGETSRTAPAKPRASERDVTVAFDSQEVVKAKSPGKPAAAKATTKAQSASTETKPTPKPAEKKPAPGASQNPNPFSRQHPPPRARTISMSWIGSPNLTASPPSAEPEPLADLGFDEEPMALEAAPEAVPDEEVDSLPPSAAEPEDVVSDWLEEPAAEAAPVEPLADLGFDEEPIGAGSGPRSCSRRRARFAPAIGCRAGS